LPKPKQQPKSEQIVNNSKVDEMSFDDKKDVLIDYVKKNKNVDKSLQAISKLGEIGEMFDNGNYSINNPHDGYISEKIDNVTKKKILVFNPKFDFDERSTYLKNDAKNGILKDYIINFEVDNTGKILSKKTILTYSKTGKVEFENSQVPDYNTLIDLKKFNRKKPRKMLWLLLIN